jgi:hypothetical protein
VALQVDPVAADPQRMVDLEPVGPPIAGLQIVAHLVVDVRDEGLGLPIGQIVGLKSLTRTHIGYSEVPSTGCRPEESNAAGEAEQKPDRRRRSR